jgi:multidrug efflux pump subunit AcrB
MTSSPRRHLSDRPVGVLAVLVAILVLGGLAIPGMRIRLFNGGEFGPGGVYVSLGVNGLAISETLDRVTRPAEEIVRSLPAADEVRSNTSNGYASLQVKPAKGFTGQQLVTQLTQAFTSHRHRFPTGMREPSINSWSGDSMPLVVVALDRGELTDDAFRDFLDRVLIPTVQTIPGVARAEAMRYGNRSVQVAFDAERLAALRLDSEKAAQVVNVVAATPPSFPLPPTDGTGVSERSVRVVPPAISPGTLASLRLDGRTSLADVATLEERDPLRDEFRILVNGKPGEALTVFGTADANVYRASHEVGRVIAEECAANGMTAHLVFNSHEAFDEIAHEILIAAGWCAAFSFLFLVVFLRRWRVAILVCAALPLSLLMAAVAMAVSGSQLSLLSLIGFLLASGMVIDNAIVIAESLLRAREENDPAERRLVLRRAANAVAMAIIVSTLTTIAMFLPVMVSGENAGRMLMVALAAPIVWSLIASLLVALVLVPLAFARIYPRGLLTGGRTTGGHGPWLIATERWYGRTLACFLLRPVLGLTVAGTLLSIGILALAVLPRPEEGRFNEERTLELRARATAKMDLDQMAELLSQWSDLLTPHRQRLGITCVLGNVWRNGGELNVYLQAVDPQGRSSDEIRREIVRLLPPQPSLILEEHRELAQFAASEVQRKERLAKFKAEEEAKKEAEKLAAAKALAEGKPDPKKAAQEKAEKEKAEKEKANDKTTTTRVTTTVQDDGSIEQEVEVIETPSLAIDFLTFTLSSPDPRAVSEASRRLNEVLVAEGGLPTDPEANARQQRQREREGRPDRGNLTLSLTRAAEEQGWRAEDVAQQVVRYTGGERALQMPGGWWLGFGRARTGDRTLRHLLETVVYQTSTTPTRAATPKKTNASTPSANVPATSVPSSTASKGNRPSASRSSSATTPPRATAATNRSSTSSAKSDPATSAPAVNAPLLNLVQPAVAPRDNQITRINGLTHGELSVTIRSSERKRILASFPALLVRAHIPPNVTVRLKEQSADRDDGMRTLWIAMFTAAAIIYLLMCILYESLLAPLTVMTTVPAGIVSVMGVFTIARMPMDPMVVLGLFLLVGIVINHGVVLVDRLGVTVPMHRLMRADGRASRRAMLAMAAASRRRFTPVLLTSLTTIAAAVPMAFSPGRIFGAPIGGLGLSLSIGLTAATVFTLLVVPIVYQWLGLSRAGTLALLRGGRTP